jgi:hypothetical protein
MSSQRRDGVSDVALGARAEPDCCTLSGEHLDDCPPDSSGTAGYQGPEPLQR